MSVALIRDGVIRPSENDSHVLTAMLPSSCPQTVSYTHLDVYKRQVPWSAEVRINGNPAVIFTPS